MKDNERYSIIILIIIRENRLSPEIRLDENHYERTSKKLDLNFFEIPRKVHEKLPRFQSSINGRTWSYYEKQRKATKSRKEKKLH